MIEIKVNTELPSTIDHLNALDSESVLAICEDGVYQIMRNGDVYIYPSKQRLVWQ